MSRALVLSLCLIAGLASTAGCAAAEEDESAREIMQRFFVALQTLLPHAETLAGSAHREEVRAAAQTLAENAEKLETHGETREGDLFIGSSLARNAHQIQSAMEHGRYERAEYLIRHLTQNCVACHSRLPGTDSPLAEQFVSGEAIAKLTPGERAILQIATRRFGDALDTLEALLLSPNISAVLLMEPLTDYLTIALRVVGDFERAQAFLRRFPQRPDVWSQLRREVEEWLVALPELRGVAVGPAELGTARALIAEARRRTEYPADRSGMLHHIVAAGLLHRFIESHPSDPTALAEAYYLLAITETRIERNYWTTSADTLLERSIHLAPGSPFAEQAYALLQEQRLLAYEGSSYESLPRREAQRLVELRRLIESAQGATN